VELYFHSPIHLHDERLNYAQGHYIFILTVLGELHESQGSLCGIIHTTRTLPLSGPEYDRVLTQVTMLTITGLQTCNTGYLQHLRDVDTKQTVLTNL
jgi:hypothetical protein